MQVVMLIREFLVTYQVYILAMCGVFSFCLAVFLLLISFQSIRRKRSLIGVEIMTGILVLSDSFCYSLQGNTSAYGYWGVRIAHFLVFAVTDMILYFLCDYLTALFMEQGKFKALPKRLLIGHIIPFIGVTLVVISQFTDLYYYFDAQNYYHRTPLYIVSMGLVMAEVLVLISFVIQYHKMLSRGIWISLMAFAFLPMLAAVLQYAFYGVALINLFFWLAAVFLFAFALLDQNNMLSKSASTEMMTGLPNTYGYLYEVERIIHYKDITDYNGFYFDIVRMGQMNNKYGKSVGDEIILKYADYIRRFLDKDEILGRLGGNFFVALVKKEHTEAFLKLLSDVPVHIKFNGADLELHIAAVAGGYEITKKNIAAGQILGNTAEAVSYAKNVTHRPYVVMDEALEKKFRRMREVEEASRKGLKTEEFEPFYQPKVDSLTRKLTGAEALARWRHDGRLVPPFQFVPIMENNGTVCDLDFYILDHVCKDIRGWLDAGMNPPCISVNFSRRNLGDLTLAADIAKIVEQNNVPKDLIQIEVTETIDEYPMVALKNVVKSLHEFGLTAAIDDFGTGSSSINLLKEVPFDVMKIDKAFVDYTDDKQKSLLASIIKMADTIGIATIAEGVEEEEKLSVLEEMGCHEIQGYVFDRPLEKKEFEERMKRATY